MNIDYLRSWIGREKIANDVVSLDLVRKFHATFDLAGEVPEIGDVAPRLIHFCLAQSAIPTATLGDDGHPRKGGFLPPVPLPRRMWAGGNVQFDGELHVGASVQRVSRIADLSVKEGRTGLLCFVTVEHTVKTEGRAVVRERQDIVYRCLDERAARTSRGPSTAGQHVKSFEPLPPVLFRYSALTFNSHRIHYDRRYATEVEGYPGLVVQGPLQATLLMHFASQINGAAPSHFSFRSLSPMFDDSTFFLHASSEGQKLKLWTAQENGPAATVAEATWCQS